jgi:phosphinothricin acetyltransferase
MQVRPGRESDLEQINAIYNHYIRTSPCTFDIDEHDLAWRSEWFARFAPTGRYRCIVAVDADRVLGMAWSSRFRDKHAYETSIETSVYVSHDAHARGVGSALYEALFSSLEGEDVHRALAGVTLPNDASLALHKRVGFEEVGVFRSVGRKFGRFWDVAWFQKM